MAEKSLAERLLTRCSIMMPSVNGWELKECLWTLVNVFFA